MIEIRVEDRKMYKKIWSRFMNDKIVKLCGVSYLVESGDLIYCGKTVWIFKLRKAE